MIDRILIRNYIKQSTLLFSTCALGLFAFAWVRVWVVSLLDMGQFQAILEQVREFERFAPIGFDSLFSYQGRVGLTFDEPIVILCTVIWCVSRGSDVVSGEIGRGTMEMLLSQPISRATLMASHALVSVCGLALLTVSVWLGIAVGLRMTTVEATVEQPSLNVDLFGWEIPLQFAEPVTESFLLSDRVDSALYFAPAFNLFAFGFFLLAMTTLLSSFDRYRWRTIGAAVGIYVIQLVMFGLGKAAESLQWLEGMTFFNCYRPQAFVALADNEGLAAVWGVTEAMPDSVLPPLFYPTFLIVAGCVFYAIAGRVFCKRDLPAPL